MNWREIERFASFPPMETVVEYRISQAEARELLNLLQQVSNLEEYMLKGVAFRDELQARIAQLEGAVEVAWAESILAADAALRAIVARVEDVERMAKVIVVEASESWGAPNWDALSESGKGHYLGIATALSAWLKEG